MLSNIKKIISNHHITPEGNNKMTSVFLPLIEIDSELHIVFEVRSHTLNSQPGEICLPGGKNEDDELPILSAIRETSEELELNEEDIEVFGGIDPIITPFNLIVYPFVGKLNVESFESIHYNHDEVDHLFSVPLRFFMDHPPEIYKVDNKMIFPNNFPFHRIPLKENYPWKKGFYKIAFYQYESYTIWGITARIINNFVRIIKGLPD